MCMGASQLSPVGGKKGWACWVCSLGRWWSWQKQRCLTNSYLVYIWPAYAHTTDYGRGFHVQLHADYGCFQQSSIVILRKITPVSLDRSECFHASSEKRLIHALKQRQKALFVLALPSGTAGNPIGNFSFGRTCRVHIPLVLCPYELQYVNNLV